jgi:hypothetical protein
LVEVDEGALPPQADPSATNAAVWTLQVTIHLLVTIGS